MLGRYCIKKYDPCFVARMQSIARHVYSTEVKDGERVIYEFEHNLPPKEVVITDRRLGLTSAQDRMSWHVFLNTGYMKDCTIAW